MKLIVDVEKDYYEIIKYNVERGQKYKPWEIIANGIPYEERPQGELISVDAIAIIKKYADIRQKVEEFNRKTTPKKHIETTIELQEYLKELEAHTMCLANQVRDIVGEVD